MTFIAVLAFVVFTNAVSAAIGYEIRRARDERQRARRSGLML